MVEFHAVKLVELQDGTSNTLLARRVRAVAPGTSELATGLWPGGHRAARLDRRDQSSLHRTIAIRGQDESASANLHSKVRKATWVSARTIPAARISRSATAR